MKTNQQKHILLKMGLLATVVTLLISSLTPSISYASVEVNTISNSNSNQPITDETKILSILSELENNFHEWNKTPGWKWTVYEQLDPTKLDDPEIDLKKSSPSYRITSLWEEVLDEQSQKAFGAFFLTDTLENGELYQVVAEDGNGRGGNLTALAQNWFAYTETTEYQNAMVKKEQDHQIIAPVNHLQDWIQEAKEDFEDLRFYSVTDGQESFLKVIAITRIDEGFQTGNFFGTSMQIEEMYRVKDGNQIRREYWLIDDEGNKTLYYSRIYTTILNGLSEMPEEVKASFDHYITEFEALQEQGVSTGTLFENNIQASAQSWPNYVGSSTANCLFYCQQDPV